MPAKPALRTELLFYLSFLARRRPGW